MRKLLVILLIACGVAILVYSGIGADNYFLLRIGDWAIQVRLFVALLFGFILLVVVSMFWKVFRGIVLGAWPRAWRKNREHVKTQSVLESVAKSDWSAGQKECIRLANKSNNPAALVINAAKCARNAGRYEEAKSIYESALEELPDWTNVVQKELCEIALLEGDIELAEQMHSELKKSRVSGIDVLLLEAKLAEEQRDWPRLQTVIMAVRKKSKNTSPLAATERRYLFNRIMEKPGSQELLAFTRFVSDVQSPPSAVIIETAKQLAMKGHNQEAEVLVRKSLTKQWSDDLIELYADMQAQSPKKQLKTAETWLSTHADSSALISALQKLAVRAENDIKAEKYARMLTEEGGATELVST